VLLRDDLVLPPPTAGETARAGRFHREADRVRYLRSHGALRAILGRLTQGRLDFALKENGKPYLPGDPRLKFNLSHSHEMALVGVALEVEIGVDVEHVRPMPNFVELAERFFPPSQAAEVEDEPDFYRRWTRIEAVLKATGAGLYGMGTEPEGEWTVAELDVGLGYAAAVALPRAGMQIIMHDWGEGE
jgi:4'-phosphopantetheinyl transferase